MRIALLPLIAMACLMPSTLSAGQLLYLSSTRDKNITAYDVDAKTGELTKKFVVDLPGSGGAMCFSPDEKFVYAAVTGLKGNKAGVATFAKAADGTLTLKKTANITSRSPYIRTDLENKNLLAAHYGDGDVTVYRIKDGVCTGELTCHIETERTAHCIELDPSGKFAYVPHTAPNKLYQFQLDADAGKLTALDPPFLDGPDTEHRYHEPRHYKHHPTLKMGFTSNENGGGITAWHYDAKTGKLTRGKTLCTLPEGTTHTSHAADIQITPDGRFAFVGNRDTTKRADGDEYKDNICSVAIDTKTGDMKIVGHVKAGRFPRPTCIDVSGKFFFAAGQRSDDLYAYRINQDTGALEHLKTYETAGTPIWVMCSKVK